MTSIAAHREFSTSGKTRTETKAEITNRAARAVIDAETQSREAKTAKLRRARIENEKRIAASPDAAKPKPAKTSRARRASPRVGKQTSRKGAAT
ncbi:MAG: hypothetical protein AAFR71_06250 [Pseudomonadota bacterium]